MRNLVSLTIILFIVFNLQPSSLLAQNNEQGEQISVEKFVKQIYIHGIPIAQAKVFTKNDVPILLRLLRDTSEKVYWSNICITLGIIGDEASINPLIDLIERDKTDTLSHEEYSAKTSAMFALGYIINKTGNNEAIEYLIKGSNPNTWAQKRLNWTNPFKLSSEEQNIQLAKMSIIGLSVSGNEKSMNFLNSLKKSQIEEQKIIRNAISEEFINRALKENKKMSRLGIEKYNIKARKKCNCN